LGVGLLRQGRVEIVSNLRSHNWGNSNDRALVKMALIQDGWAITLGTCCGLVWLVVKVYLRKKQVKGIE